MKQPQALREAIKLLAVQVKAWGIFLSAEQLALLNRYAELLANYSAANIIGTKEIQSVVVDHILDSLSCLLVQDALFGEHVIDVGSGGGLPGIPLAITLPDSTVTLLEATEKKATFLRLCLEYLPLQNAQVLNQRAEEAGGQEQFRDTYGIAVSRALASLSVVVEYCAPFVRRGGLIVAMKGRLEAEELTSGRKSADKLGAELLEVVQVPIMHELQQKQRRIVVFRKVASTPTGYPRRIGLAKKRPIGVSVGR